MTAEVVVSGPDPRSGVQPDGSWVPAFDRQRPPFTSDSGSQAALQHGAYAPAKVQALARELVDRVLADDAARYAHAPVYRYALWSWARAEAQVQLLTEYLADRGQESGDGVGDLEEDRVRSAYLLLHRAESRATTQRARLGLDPLSRARLGKDVAAGQLDTARLMAELDERDRRARAAADQVPPAVER